MARYELWDETELRSSIKEIEVNLAGGITSISNPTQGGIQYQSRLDAEAILKDLYRAYWKLTGQTDKLRNSGNAPRIWALSGGREF